MAHIGKVSSSYAPKIFFAHGPGDATGTLKSWASNAEDDSIIAKTYSAQMFDLAKELGSELLVVTDNPYSQALKTDRISVESLPQGNMGSGWRYWVNMKKNAELVAHRASNFGADVAIVSLHYGLLSLAAFRKYKIPVILDMHNTLWPMGIEPHFLRLLFFKAMTIKGKSGLQAVVAISPECTRQLNRLIPETSVFEHIPQYPESLQFISSEKRLPHPSEEFRILFAGRLEAKKGIFDLLKAAEILISEGYTQVKWVIAGSGNAEDQLKIEIEQRSLSPYFELKGQLCRSGLTKEFIKANATITPTCAGFPEGLAKAPLESLIFGIPALLSSVVPATEVIKNAAIVFEPSSPTEIAISLMRLLGDSSYYDSICKSAKELRHLLFNNQYSFKNAVLRALERTIGT